MILDSYVERSAERDDPLITGVNYERTRGIMRYLEPRLAAQEANMPRLRREADVDLGTGIEDDG
jgi:hypothetical protein